MTALAGVHILIVEDDALVAGMLADMLTELGAVVVGPAPSVAEGMSLATGEEIDVAILDVRLRGERVDPIALALRTRGIPTAPDAPLLDKPYSEQRLRDVLLRLLGAGRPRQQPV
jgi:DNA-binding response OmpR family regulator